MVKTYILTTSNSTVVQNTLPLAVQCADGWYTSWCCRLHLFAQQSGLCVRGNRQQATGNRQHAIARAISWFQLYHRGWSLFLHFTHFLLSSHCHGKWMNLNRIHSEIDAVRTRIPELARQLQFWLFANLRIINYSMTLLARSSSRLYYQVPVLHFCSMNIFCRRRRKRDRL